MENTWLLKLADIFFFVFHIALIIFNLFGWVYRPLRKYNLATLLLTAFSWFGLGVFYGWGYCFLTDWHWEVRSKLGYAITSNSYIHFLIYKMTGWNLSETFVDILTVTCFALALLLSLILNIKSLKR